MPQPLFPSSLGPPPKDDTIEITLLGPGYGESIVLHLPGVGWGVVDSCVVPKKWNSCALPLAYLQALKVGSVNFALLSHPHEDHFRGLDEVIEAYPSIKLVGRYAGDADRELKKYWARQDLNKVEPDSDALSRVFNAMRSAAEKGAKYIRLSEMQQLVSVNGTIGGTAYQTDMKVLSPSGISQERYADALRKCLPKEGKRLKQLKPADYNLIASAIWIQVNGTKILLGSDVEKGGHKQTGWKGIVSSPACPDLAINTIKVAHHGSTGAHHQPAWSRHKINKPLAVLTPYCKGANSLPKQSDLLRIKDHSAMVGFTGEIKFEGAGQHYGSSIARQSVFDFKNWKILSKPTKVGLLRIRYDLSGSLIERLALEPAQWLP